MRLDGIFGTPFLVDFLEVRFTPFFVLVFCGCSVMRLGGFFGTPFCHASGLRPPSLRFFRSGS